MRPIRQHSVQQRCAGLHRAEQLRSLRHAVDRRPICPWWHPGGPCWSSSAPPLHPAYKPVSQMNTPITSEDLADHLRHRAAIAIDGLDLKRHLLANRETLLQVGRAVSGASMQASRTVSNLPPWRTLIVSPSPIRGWWCWQPARQLGRATTVPSV